MPINDYKELFNQALNIGNFYTKDIHFMLYGMTQDEMTLKEFREQGLIMTKEKADAWNNGK